MVVLGGIAASGIVAGCTATGALPSTGPTAAASAAPSTPPPAASPAATASQEASLAEPSPAAALSPIPSGATQIDWGVLWDTLPPNFPRYPGA